MIASNGIDITLQKHWHYFLKALLLHRKSNPFISQIYFYRFIQGKLSYPTLPRNVLQYAVLCESTALHNQIYYWYIRLHVEQNKRFCADLLYNQKRTSNWWIHVQYTLQHAYLLIHKHNLRILLSRHHLLKTE